MNPNIRIAVFFAVLLMAGCGSNERETAPVTAPSGDEVVPSEPAPAPSPDSDTPAAPSPGQPSELPDTPVPVPEPEPEPESEPLPQVSLSVAPEQGEAPLTVTLQWSSTNAQHCAADGATGSGGLALQGETELRLDAPGNYGFAVVCGNDRGERRAERTVVVTDPFAEARQLYERRQLLLRAADAM